MSNELVRYGQKALVASGDKSFKQEAGAALVKTGLGTLAVVGVAAFIPFLSALWLAVAMLVLGGVLYLK